jgi:hypothetical protein
MEELWNAISPNIIEIVTAMLLALLGFVGAKVRVILNTKIKRDIVEDTVKYVEQVARTLGLTSEQKFELARKEIIKLLGSVGLKISEEELKILIESMVIKFFENYESPLFNEKDETEGTE